MHNGGVARFRAARARLVAGLRPELLHALTGVTDSEVCFMVFLSHFADATTRQARISQ